MNEPLSNAQREALCFVLSQAILHGRYHARLSMQGKYSSEESKAIMVHLFYLLDAIHNVPELLDGRPREFDEDKFVDLYFMLHDRECQKSIPPKLSLGSTYRRAKKLSEERGGKSC